MADVKNLKNVKTKSKIFYGIRKKFLGVLVPIVVVGFIALSFISYRESSVIVNEEAETNVKAVGSEAAVMLKGEICTRKIIVETLADSAEFNKATIEQKIQMMKDAKTAIDGLAMIAYSDLKGNATNNNSKECLRDENNTFLFHFVYNRKGLCLNESEKPSNTY